LIDTQVDIYLIDVGNMPTTELTNAVDDILPSVMYIADKISVVTAFLAKNSEIPQTPEIISP
jgi:hypothetical protein